MTIQETVEEIITTLNPQWFETVKKEFVANPFYDKKTKQIGDLIEQYQYVWDPDTGEEKGFPETIVLERSLLEYSWRGFDTPVITEFNEHVIFKGEKLSSEIIDAVDIIINEIIDVKERHTLIKATVQSMVDESTKLKEQLNDSEYHDIIDYCIEQIRYELSKKYKNIKKAHDSIERFDDRLCFNMNKKKLALLLAILTEAGFIHGSSDRNSTFRHFFNDYFYFKNQRKRNSFTPATNIHKEIADIYSPENVEFKDLIPEMKNDLLKAMQNLRK